MSYDKKLATATHLLKQFKDTNPNSSLKPDNLKNDLANIGGTTEDALKFVSWEDLSKFGIPTLLAKQITSIFRENPTKTKIKDLTNEELFKQYNPYQHSNRVGEELKRRSKGQKCVVFDSDNKLIPEVSAKLLSDLEEFGEREYYYLNSIPVSVFRVGQIPDLVYKENPLFIGKALLSDEVCPETNFDWSKSSPVVRTIIYLAVRETKELPIKTYNDAMYIIDLLAGENVDNRIRMRFKKASLSYDKKVKVGGLPAMIIESAKNKINDPFYNKTY